MEIEKKYLIEKIDFPLNSFTHKTFIQGYISTDPTIRLRQEGDDYVLCMKGSGTLQREEYELKITKTQFDNLWKKTENRCIHKERYFIPLEGGLTAELDIYSKELTGLMTVEVEFESLNGLNAFIPPEWFGKDVTLDNRYKNSNLSIYGLPSSK